MGYTCTKYKTRYDNNPIEVTKVWETRRQMCTWLYRHRHEDNTLEMHVQDTDGDLMYYYNKGKGIEEMYRKDGTLATVIQEMGN